jgi:hypothetical protein
VKSIELTDEEIQALADLMNAGVKHIGLACVKNAAHLLTKLEGAKPVEQTPEE